MKNMKKWLLMIMTALSVVTFAAGCSSDSEDDTGTEENMDEGSNTDESNTEE
ncbi:hypothetical protein NQ095_00020 [Rossellomorea sp. SC111]|uniref:hypothetical protein n=1 Tax=Rossellomorea sp. SC111 TaxID=2968985 RepID=UPI00215B2F8B|nr:hypothetical protein [Rossellomorea sp. SC111]MCR8846773.1 hypothetical protein [Rossellomorea sp. SC111]